MESESRENILRIKKTFSQEAGKASALFSNVSIDGLMDVYRKTP